MHEVVYTLHWRKIDEKKDKKLYRRIIKKNNRTNINNQNKTYFDLLLAKTKETPKNKNSPLTASSIITIMFSPSFLSPPPRLASFLLLLA